MSEQKYGTIRIPRDEYEKHNQKRKEMGLTWAEYMNGETSVGHPIEDMAEEIRELRKQIEALQARA